MTFKWLCKIIGHKYGAVRFLIAVIKDAAVNRGEFLGTEVRCERCHEVVKRIT